MMFLNIESKDTWNSYMPNHQYLPINFLLKELISYLQLIKLYMVLLFWFAGTLDEDSESSDLDLSMFFQVNPKESLSNKAKSIVAW